jgi:hypothetical protein
MFCHLLYGTGYTSLTQHWLNYCLTQSYFIISVDGKFYALDILISGRAHGARMTGMVYTTSSTDKVTTENFLSIWGIEASS